jgi:hypothetical protein
MIMRIAATALLVTALLPASAHAATLVTGPNGNRATIRASIDGHHKLTVLLPSVTDRHRSKCTWVVLLVRRTDGDRRAVPEWRSATNRNCTNRTVGLPTFTRGDVKRAWAQLCVSRSAPTRPCSRSWTRLV